MQGMQPHSLEKKFLDKIWAKFGQNLANWGKIWAKFGQIWAKVIKIWANLIRFEQNQNLSSQKH